MTIRRAFVTGGSGFAGRNLIPGAVQGFDELDLSRNAGGRLGQCFGKLFHGLWELAVVGEIDPASDGSGRIAWPNPKRAETKRGPARQGGREEPREP